MQKNFWNDLNRGWLGLAKVLTCILAFILIILPGARAAPTEVILYNFPGDGETPNSGLVGDASGALYGTAARGGDFDLGTIYKLIPPVTSASAWTRQVLYSFKGASNLDGAYPGTGSLVLDPSGALYGTTTLGGSSDAGTVFKLTPPAVPTGAWIEQVLYAFRNGNTDGGNPNGTLLMDSSGALYGTAQNGGGSVWCLAGCGIVFKLTPPVASGGIWTESVLHAFSGGDGANPYYGVIADAAGTLYGTTSTGGSGYGTAFKLIPPPTSMGFWTEEVIYGFVGVNSYAVEPSGLTAGQNGTLYGATRFGGTGGCTYLGVVSGCGAAFELVPPTISGGAWTENVLHNFSGSDGSHPEGGLTAGPGGRFFGTTFDGGFGGGVVFALIPPKRRDQFWAEETLHVFTNSDGAFPTAAPILGPHGVLYGLTSAGGAFEGGTLFDITR